MRYQKRKKIRKAISVMIVGLSLIAISCWYDGGFKNFTLNTIAHASLEDVILPEIRIFGCNLSAIRFPDISFHRLMSVLHKPVEVVADLKNSLKDEVNEANMGGDETKANEVTDDSKYSSKSETDVLDIEISQEDMKSTADILANAYFNFFLDLIDNKYNDANALEHFIDRYCEKGTSN